MAGTGAPASGGGDHLSSSGASTSTAGATGVDLSTRSEPASTRSEPVPRSHLASPYRKVELSQGIRAEVAHSLSYDAVCLTLAGTLRTMMLPAIAAKKPTVLPVQPKDS